MTDAPVTLDALTACAVRVSAAVGTRTPSALVEPLDEAEELAKGRGQTVVKAVDEVLLQSILFVGYPAALNALASWRQRAPSASPATEEAPDDWPARGEQVCKAVYGAQFGQLRENIRALHPDVERWMISDGYGRVLGRPGLNLITRELAIVAQLAVLGAHRQLFSHALGALRVGAAAKAVSDTLAIAAQWIPMDGLDAVERVWSDVQEKASAADFSHAIHPS